MQRETDDFLQDLFDGETDTEANDTSFVASPGDDDSSSEEEAGAEPSKASELATWGSHLDWVDPGSLSNHALWHELLGEEAPEREEELRDHIRESGVLQPLIITGDGCASGPDVILSGHRLRQAAMDVRIRKLPVIRRVDLTAEAEEILVIKHGLSGQHTRRLRPSKVAALEARLFEIYARTPGFRTDLDTSVGSNGGSPRGDTIEVVATETGHSRNSVADRRKVFGSPIGTDALRKAVDEEKISLTEAARIVREVEKATGITGSAEATEEDVAVAREQVDQQLGRPARKAKAPKSKSTGCITTKLKTDHEGARIGSVTIKGYRWSVSIVGDELTMTRLGKDLGGGAMEEQKDDADAPLEAGSLRDLR